MGKCWIIWIKNVYRGLLSFRGKTGTIAHDLSEKMTVFFSFDSTFPPVTL